MDILTKVRLMVTGPVQPIEQNVLLYGFFQQLCGVPQNLAAQLNSFI
ncbi:hypothetical protein GGU45_004001 [Niabella hirudinis]